MAGRTKLSSIGRKLITNTGKIRLSGEDCDNCCGCWKIAVRCICDPIPFEVDSPPDKLYIPCDLITEDIVFEAVGPFIGREEEQFCYAVGPNSDEVAQLPDGITETTDISNVFDSCNACCKEEACCLPDGSCRNFSRSRCIARGGTPQGVLTKCSDPDIDCALDQACCFPEGDCLDLIPSDCVVQGGIPQGRRTECVDIDCPALEACCLPNGTCINITPGACQLQMGVPMGEGTSCSDPDIECDCPCPDVITVRLSGFSIDLNCGNEVCTLTFPTASFLYNPHPTISCRWVRQTLPRRFFLCAAHPDACGIIAPGTNIFKTIDGTWPSQVTLNFYWPCECFDQGGGCTGSCISRTLYRRSDSLCPRGIFDSEATVTNTCGGSCDGPMVISLGTFQVL